MWRWQSGEEDDSQRKSRFLHIPNISLLANSISIYFIKLWSQGIGNYSGLQLTICMKNFSYN